MKLNCNFDPTLESVINLCPPLQIGLKETKKQWHTLN